MAMYKKHYKKNSSNQPPTLGRVKLPNEADKEILGNVISMLGGGRLLVACKDGKERVCRIPGNIKRNIWVRDGDTVIIKQWDIEPDKKGDIVWRYSRLQVQWLRDNGHIKSM